MKLPLPDRPKGEPVQEIPPAAPVVPPAEPPPLPPPAAPSPMTGSSLGPLLTTAIHSQQRVEPMTSAAAVQETPQPKRARRAAAPRPLPVRWAMAAGAGMLAVAGYMLMNGVSKSAGNANAGTPAPPTAAPDGRVSII